MSAKPILMILLPHLLFGNIIETSQFSEILTQSEKHSPERILIVCDIDNTLIRGSQHLGSVPWADYMIAQFERKGISKKQAEQIQHILWIAVQPYINVSLVDATTTQVIQEIQRRNIAILGLTARSSDEADYTLKQLLSVDIDLGNDPSDVLLEDVLYTHNILFGSPFNKKSQVLFTFLDKHSINPECIIFIDDKQHHIHDLDRACTARNIAFVGIRFSGADPYLKSFDPQIAEIQWAAFPTILTDEQAQNLSQQRLLIIN